MVPNGWEVKSLSSITKWSSGGTPSKNNPDYWNGDIPWISAASMRGHYFEKSELRITDLAVSNGAKMAPKDSLLLLVRGSMLWNKIPVGITAKKVSFNQDVKCLVPHADELTTEFLLYWFLTYEHRLMNMVTGTGIGAGKLDTTDLQSLDVFLPPLPEQRKIAKILSTWDKAITTAEKLIETSKQQKKALMQQLLTGKKRLVNPETGKAFEGEWNSQPISSLITESRIAGTNGELARKLTVKLYGRGVTQKEEKRLGSSSTKYYKRKSGQFIYSKLDFLNGAFGIIPEHLDGFESTLDLPAFDFSEQVEPKWFIEFVSRDDFYTSNLGLANGGRKARRVNPKDLLQIKVQVPSLKEQQKIASVLTAADNEIEVHEVKLAHFKQEKKALMQQLLTGKKRVVI